MLVQGHDPSSIEIDEEEVLCLNRMPGNKRMETVEYGHGPLPFEFPPDAAITEITPYLWPGHYGEWDQAAQEFTAWALATPATWHVTSEILSPPLTCLSVGATVLRWRFRNDLPHALQEFHVELRRSSQLSDPPLQLTPESPLKTHPAPPLKTHPAPPLKTHPAPPLKTHPESPLKTHPAPPLKTHPESLLKTHPESLLKTHPESLLKTYPEPPQTKTHPEQVRAPMKGQLAVWRIHTKIHTRSQTTRP